MHKNFNKAFENIKNRYNYLMLLEYNGSNNNALFLDKDYGSFIGKYNAVLTGQKNHPERVKINRKEKTSKTNLEKYGVKNISQSNEIKKKIKENNIKKYGVSNVSQISAIKQKKKESCLRNYGVDVPIKSKKIQNKIKQTNLERYGCEHPQQNKIIKEKTKKTNLEKYGHISPLHNANIIDRIKQNNIKKYGVDHPKKSKKVKDNIIKNNLKKYGVEHTLQLPFVKEKINKTNLEKYGYAYPIQNESIKNKSKKTNLINGNIININENSLLNYYSNSNLKLFRSYTSVWNNYKTYGDVALNAFHYNKLFGQSKIANLWLNTIEKELGYELIREYHIPTTLYRADGYDPKTNTIYEFYGDYWHGNLEKFAAENNHPVKNGTYKDVYNETIERQNKIKSLGYNFIFIWENDVSKQTDEKI